MLSKVGYASKPEHACQIISVNKSCPPLSSACKVERLGSALQFAESGRASLVSIGTGLQGSQQISQHMESEMPQDSLSHPALRLSSLSARWKLLIQRSVATLRQKTFRLDGDLDAQSRWQHTCIFEVARSSLLISFVLCRKAFWRCEFVVGQPLSTRMPLHSPQRDHPLVRLVILP